LTNPTNKKDVLFILQSEDFVFFSTFKIINKNYGWPQDNNQSGKTRLFASTGLIVPPKLTLSEGGQPVFYGFLQFENSIKQKENDVKV